ncbi:MAG: DUF484 family protein [Gammaproteobacteria bacterium]
MTQQVASTTKTESIDAEAISAFLKKNPDFFIDYPTLLANLQLQHQSGDAVSLIERQVTSLREQNEQLKKRLNDLIQVAHENNAVIHRMHELTLNLVGKNTLASLLTTLHEHLSSDLDADSLVAHITDLPDDVANPDFVIKKSGEEQISQLFDSICQSGQPFCGRPKQSQLDFLFPQQTVDITSATVIPLGDKASLGLLAIGSRNPDRFTPGMGTLFLEQLGQLLTRLIRSLDN